jgi:hypothetical protein
MLAGMIRFSLVVIAWSVLLAGCAGPGAGTVTSNAPAPGPGCSACIQENPGDVRPCEKICHAPASDRGGAAAGGVIR